MSNQQILGKTNVRIAPGNKKAARSKKSKKKNNNSSVQLAPVSLGVKNRISKPKMLSAPNGGFRISHREYIKDIIGSTSIFAISDSIRVNPGLSPCFPWLSSIARRFESYKFHRLSFIFNTESATSSTGFVALCPDYNSSDSVPSSKTVALQFEDSVKVAPWENISMVASAHNLNKRKTYFVRSGDVSATENIDLYDVCYLHACEGGQASAATVGELWVDYEVDLITPQIETSPGELDSARAVGSGTQSAAVPFGDTGTLTFSGNTFLTYTGATGAFTATVAGSFSFGIKYSGTGITAMATSGTATISTLSAEVVLAAGTAGLEIYKVVFTPGQTFIPSATATTITAATAIIGYYSAS